MRRGPPGWHFCKALRFLHFCVHTGEALNEARQAPEWPVTPQQSAGKGYGSIQKPVLYSPLQSVRTWNRKRYPAVNTAVRR
ncbi:hypothetical protein SGGMMB4_03057 [Sodalis glossinidius str. 'morsitans']|uniref:Uncharacterized protein n=1 Tax=Sodalis glossinidius (strain morsitans) TaxID=343509 RepID=A0A193QJP4_SODGM|nr:hypothetical protein SGGMMB4_03057 [Sodalis glossinidius str. 'morsitans']